MRMMKKNVSALQKADDGSKGNVSILVPSENRIGLRIKTVFKGVTNLFKKKEQEKKDEFSTKALGPDSISEAKKASEKYLNLIKAMP